MWLLNSAQTNEGLRKKNKLWVHIRPMCIILHQVAFMFSAADLVLVNKIAIFAAKSYLDYSLTSRPILTGVATEFCSDKWRIEKKEQVMSAHSTNVHHSAPSSFRVFCSRLGSCQQNCNFCCQMLKPCWLLPHVLNTLSSQLVLAMMLFPPLDTKPFSSFAH